MYKIAKENLAALFQLIAGSRELYLPVKVSGQVNFRAWSEDAEVDLDTLKTVNLQKTRSSPRVRICIPAERTEKS